MAIERWFFQRFLARVEERFTLDVHFISSLPVKQQPACMAWVDKRPAQIVGVES